MITIQVIVNEPIEKIWEFWTKPEHVMNWNNASDDWHCPKAENDLKNNGKFSYTMASKDGAMSFDFEGIYSNIIELKFIESTISDGRKVRISFEETKNGVEITESFDPENIHPEEFQKQGWQAILDNFKKYIESN
jgi:uncharacterized protein YndB with AHSA1/START domain